MGATHFVTVERLEQGRTHFYVVHTREPRFTVEVEPEVSSDGSIQPGPPRRVCVPNSWCGGYQRQAALIDEALHFFAASMQDGRSRPGRG